MDRMNEFLFLLTCSVTDIRDGKIYPEAVLPFLAVYPLMAALKGGVCPEDAVYGMIPGTVLLILSLISGGRIGAGDGMVIIISGLFIGLRDTLLLLRYGMLGAFSWSAVLMLTERKKADYEIPFVPFLLAAFVFILVLRFLIS